LPSFSLIYDIIAVDYAKLLLARPALLSSSYCSSLAPYLLALFRFLLPRHRLLVADASEIAPGIIVTLYAEIDYFRCRRRHVIFMLEFRYFLFRA
jgi:hypothetical protein